MLHHECRRGTDKRDKQRAEHRNHPAFELIKASLRFLSRNCELLAVLRLRRVEFAVDFSSHLREFATHLRELLAVLRLRRVNFAVEFATHLRELLRGSPPGRC